MKTTFFAVMMMMTIALMSCNDEGAAVSGLAVNMKATTTVSKVSKGGRVQAGGYTFEQALLGVREFEFETKEEDNSEDDLSGSSSDDDGEDDNEEVEFKGQYVVDLIKGTSTPELDNGKLKPGIYEEFEVELDRYLANGNSLFIVFKYKPDTGDSVKVEVSTKATLEFEFEDDNGFEIVDEKVTNYLVLINLDNLFTGVDLSTAIKSEDGVIRINDTTNTSLLSIIKNNFDTSCEGGKDDDNDDDIDDDND